MQKNSPLVVVFFIYFLWIGLSMAKESVPSLFVFGDSLVDVGNNNYLTLSIAKANYPHNGVDYFPTRKPTGRFSNGKNIADLLAEKLGLPSPPPYLSLECKEDNSSILNGVSFASGGSGIFNSFHLTLGQVITLSDQINNYISVHEDLMNQLQPSVTKSRLSKSIFMIIAGSNDLLDYFRSFELRWKMSPHQYTTSMATKLKEHLKRLYNYGARKFVVSGLGQIGCIPRQRLMSPTQECNEEVNMWCSIYNEALKRMLQKLRLELHGSFSYSFYDNYKAVQDIFANPAAYGFRDVKSACCGSGTLNAELPCLPLSRYCSNRTQYFFWDLFGHPTEASTRIFIDQMFDSSSRYSFPINVQQLVSLRNRAGKRAKTMKDFVASSGSSSPVRERGALRLSAVKLLVLRDKEDKLGFTTADEEKLVSLIHSFFDAESDFLSRRIDSNLESHADLASVLKDIHGTPPSSFVVKLAEVIGSFTTLRRMTLF